MKVGQRERMRIISSSFMKGMLNQSNFKNKSKIPKMFHLERKNKECFPLTLDLMVFR